MADMTEPAPPTWVTLNPDAGNIVLDPVEAGTIPPYCIHGRVTCARCPNWCWLGDISYQLVSTGQMKPLCRPCAQKLYPPGTPCIGHVEDHRRADGPH